MPALRFRGFYDTWEQRKSKDLFIPKIKKGKTELPVLSVTQTSGVVYRDEVGIDIKYNRNTLSNYKVIEPNDFVISLRSFQGGFELSNKLGIASPAYTVFTPKDIDEHANLFWKYKFKTFSFIQSLKTVTFGIRDGKSISFSEFGDLKIRFPKNIREQEKIGLFFKQLDSLITQNEHKTRLLKQLKQAYLQKIFNQELRFAGFSDDWEERKLGELASVLTGFPFKNEDFVANGKYLVITNGNIQNDSSVVDVLLGNSIDDISDEIKERYYLNKNDILVTMDGTVGRTAKVVDDNLILAQRVGRLVSNTNPEFVYQWLNHGSFFNEMTKVSHGGTIKHISLNEISNYRSTVPSNNIEQQKIGAFFKQLDITIDLHQQKLDLLKKQKQAYLQKLFI